MWIINKALYLYEMFYQNTKKATSSGNSMINQQDTSHPQKVAKIM